jgi:hypothetical protein
MTAATPATPAAPTRSALGAAGRGARFGFLLALAYGAIFALYAIVRSGWQIVTTLPPSEGMLGTLAANTAAIAFAALWVTLMFAVIAAAVGAVTMAAAYGLAGLFHAQNSPAGRVTLGVLVALVLVAGLQWIVIQAAGRYGSAFWPAGYWFWLGLPSLLFVVGIGWLNRR